MSYKMRISILQIIIIILVIYFLFGNSLNLKILWEGVLNFCKRVLKKIQIFFNFK
jgi:Sec-independent protein translocase protein TatA